MSCSRGKLRHQLVAEDLRSLIETASTPIFGVDATGRVVAACSLNV